MWSEYPLNILKHVPKAVNTLQIHHTGLHANCLYIASSVCDRRPRAARVLQLYRHAAYCLQRAAGQRCTHCVTSHVNNIHSATHHTVLASLNGLSYGSDSIWRPLLIKIHIVTISRPKSILALQNRANKLLFVLLPYLNLIYVKLSSLYAIMRYSDLSYRTVSSSISAHHVPYLNHCIR